MTTSSFHHGKATVSVHYQAASPTKKQSLQFILRSKKLHKLKTYHRSPQNPANNVTKTHSNR